MSTQVQPPPNLTSDHAPFNRPPSTGPRIQPSRAKSAAIRRGELKISGPIPIDNVVIIDHDEDGNATARTLNKRHTDPSAFISASVEDPETPQNGANTSKKLVRHNTNTSEATLRPSTVASHKSLNGSPPRSTPAVPDLPYDDVHLRPPLKDKTSFQQVSSVNITSEPRERGENPVQYTATVSSRGSPSPMNVSRVDPPGDRRSGEKKGLRGTLRKLFGRRSKGPDGDKRRSRMTPSVAEYERENARMASTAPPSTPTRDLDIGGPSQTHTPVQSQQMTAKGVPSPVEEEQVPTPLKKHLPFPMNVNASPPESLRVDGRPSVDGRGHRRRATLPSVVFNSTEIATLNAVWGAASPPIGSQPSPERRPSTAVRTAVVETGSPPGAIGVAVTSPGHTRASSAASRKMHRRSRSAGNLGDSARWHDPQRREAEKQALRSSWVSMTETGGLTERVTSVVEVSQTRPREDSIERTDTTESWRNSLETAHTTQSLPQTPEPRLDFEDAPSATPTPRGQSPVPEPQHRTVRVPSTELKGFNFGSFNQTPVETPVASQSSLDQSADMDNQRSYFPQKENEEDEIKEEESLFLPRRHVAPYSIPPAMPAPGSAPLDDRLSRLESQYAGLESALNRLSGQNHRHTIILESNPAPASAPLLGVGSDPKWRTSLASSRYSQDDTPVTAKHVSDILGPTPDPNRLSASSAVKARQSTTDGVTFYAESSDGDSRRPSVVPSGGDGRSTSLSEPAPEAPTRNSGGSVRRSGGGLASFFLGSTKRRNRQKGSQGGSADLRGPPTIAETPAEAGHVTPGTQAAAEEPPRAGSRFSERLGEVSGAKAEVTQAPSAAAVQPHEATIAMVSPVLEQGEQSDISRQPSKRESSGPSAVQDAEKRTTLILDDLQEGPFSPEPNTPTTAIATLAHHVAHERAARKALEREVREVRAEMERLRAVVLELGKAAGVGAAA